ncbi:MAG: DNA polymerase III subunit gamma/tau, partial [Burkholderiales bacterium]|nr:DNA polymerase III subunit gamma/tau [Burkholderiales bacterium]
MNHTVLARKWRPKKFNDLVGQQTTVTILRNIIASNKLHHAYLLTGTRGVGKTTIARIIAKAFNCTNLINSEPCCACSICNAIDSGRFIDVIEIDAASNTGVDNIREVIDNARYTPTEGKYKVYIIDEVHMLSKSAFNAMLKTLEEPPSHIIFILATTDPQKLPITVVSRCLQLKLRNLMINEISDYLIHVLSTEKIQFENNALELIANFANGSMRDALSLLDQAIAFSNNNISYEITSKMLGNTDLSIIYLMLDKIINLNGSKLVDIAQEIYTNGYDLENCLQNLSKLLCDISITQLTNSKTSNSQIQHYAKSININSIQLYFEICNLGLEQIKIVNDKYSTFVMTILRMLAFNLGTDNNKQSLLNSINNNSQPTESKPHPPIDIQMENTVTKHAVDNITVPRKLQAKTQTKVKVDVNQKNTFNGNWIELVTILTSSLRHSAPFLENSELIDYSNNVFSVKFDNRYQNSFTDHTYNEILTAIKSKFNKDTSLTYIFTDELIDTVKTRN